MPYADWAAVARDLTMALERLDDREFLILGEPRKTEAPRGLFGRRRPVPTRYVQVLRVGEVLSAECVGAASLGGTLAMSPETIEQLRSLCWLTPAESRAELGVDSPNFELYVTLETAHELPELLVASLAILNTPPQALVLESSGGAAAMVG